jgi:hypothetical protein
MVSAIAKTTAQECQSAGKVCDAYKQKKAERDQYIALTGRYPFKFN